MADGAVNCIHPFTKDRKNLPNSRKDLDRSFVYGLSDSSFINIMMEPDKPVYLWSLAAQTGGNKAGISLIKVYDFQNRGVNDIIIVRDNSEIELYGLSSTTDYEQFYSQSLNEGVTGIDAGQISAPGLNEFIVSTYSGKIVGFSDSQEFNKNNVDIQPGKDSDKKVTALKGEIEKLRAQLKKLKDV